MSVVVELFGTPGAGKSYLADEVASLTAEAGLVVGRFPPPSARSKLAAILGHRRTALVAARALARSSRPLRQKADAARFLVVTLERFDAARRDGSDAIYLFEEGPVQRVFLLFADADGFRADLVPTYLHRAPLADLIVHVTAGSEVVDERLAGRERGLPTRFEAVPRSRALDVLDEADDHVAVALHREVERRRADAPTGRAPALLPTVSSDDAVAVVAALTA